MTSKNTLIIGTRGSALALAQADMVCAALSLRYPELDVRREIIHTMRSPYGCSSGGCGPRFRHGGQGNLY